MKHFLAGVYAGCAVLFLMLAISGQQSSPMLVAALAMSFLAAVLGLLQTREGN